MWVTTSAAGDDLFLVTRDRSRHPRRELVTRGANSSSAGGAAAPAAGARARRDVRRRGRRGVAVPVPVAGGPGAEPASWCGGMRVPARRGGWAQTVRSAGGRPGHCEHVQRRVELVLG